jgi:hypothetical protein
MTCVWDSLIKGIPLEEFSSKRTNNTNTNFQVQEHDQDSNEEKNKSKKYKAKENKKQKRKKNKSLKAFKKKVTPDTFVSYLKMNNTKTNNIIVNDELLTDKLLEENFNTIKNYDIKNIRNGYLCSTCDPFLLLVCELFECSIWNNYCSSVIKYEHPSPKFRMYISNDDGHMRHAKTNQFNKN